jgi:hypothetical protein
MDRLPAVALSIYEYYFGHPNVTNPSVFRGNSAYRCEEALVKGNKGWPEDRYAES